MWQLRKENWLVPSKNYLDDAGNDKLLHWLLLSLVCWLMLARRLCAYNAGLKVDASREILTVVMTSCYENIHLCKRHAAVCCMLWFWRFALLFLGLATHYREFWYHESWFSLNCMEKFYYKLLHGTDSLIIWTKYGSNN